MFVKFDSVSNKSVHMVGLLLDTDNPSEWTTVSDELAQQGRLVNDPAGIRPETKEERDTELALLAISSQVFSVRRQRDVLLAESDKLVLQDLWVKYSAATKTAVSTYRQELRDLPLQSGFPTDVIFPTVPTTV